MTVRTVFAALLLLACKSPRAAPPAAPVSVAPPGPDHEDAPAPDHDGDGYVDTSDRCPDAPGVAPDGCPIPDTDGDGILDPDDRCPGEAERFDGIGDSDGCPDAIPEELAAITGVIAGLQFEIEKDILRPSSFPVLDRAAELLAKYPELRIEISVHTDSTYSPDYGRDLPRRRAEAIRAYLVAHGVEPGRLEARSAGPDEPIASNRTAAGRAKNRRVEFEILARRGVGVL